MGEVVKKERKKPVTKFLSVLHDILEVSAVVSTPYRRNNMLTALRGRRMGRFFRSLTRIASHKKCCPHTSSTTTTPRSFDR
jgi:hypothetical protein